LRFVPRKSHGLISTSTLGSTNDLAEYLLCFLQFSSHAFRIDFSLRIFY